MFRKGLLCAGFITITAAVAGQSLTADQTYTDAKRKFSVSYVKEFVQKKNGSSVEFSSKDKGVIVTINAISASDAAAIAKKQGKAEADTLVILKSVLDSQKVSKELDPSSNTLSSDAIAPMKAAAGSAVKYGIKKSGGNYTCRAAVYTNGKIFVALSYAILEKKGNEKYEKPAGAMMKSFAFAE